MHHSNCCEHNRETSGRAVVLDALDSRALGRTSCYAQRFMRPGSYPYNIVQSHGQPIGARGSFLIKVSEEKGGEMTQHNVLVAQEGSTFEAEPRELSIRVGDLVLWSSNGSTGTPFAIVGEQDFFNSSRMVNECGYSHAFGLPGKYNWVDAHGSKLRGTVRVTNPEPRDQKAFARWQKQLSEGKLVMITDGKVDQPELDVVVGQTVFFAVVTSGGISITDERLLNIRQDAAAD